MRRKPRVLLIGWDAADWEHITPLLDSGKLPVLQQLVEDGVMGNLATLQPVLSPMLWNSLATGKHAWKHKILGFVEPDDQHGGSRVTRSSSRATKALWNMLSESGYRTNVVNWWASHPAEPVNGCIASNLIQSIKRVDAQHWQVPEGCVFPAEAVDLVREMRVLPEEITREQVQPFVPRCVEVDQDNDDRLSILAEHLAEMLTTHNVATAIMEHTDWDFMAVYYTAIDHFCHSFVQYHPPQLPWIPDHDFGLYKDVINSVYRFSDMTLRRLLDLAGEDTTIILCSDHGFHSREQRLRMTPNEPAGPTAWHRKYGILVASGPGIKRDQRVYGASLLDIAPTILQLFGLPVGKDMDGRVLSEILVEPPEIERIESWDDRSGSPPQASPTCDESSDSDELMQQFVALGYIDAPAASREEQYEFAKTECEFNLARNLNSCGRLAEAKQLFRELLCRYPWEDRFILHYANNLLAAQEHLAARRLLELAYDLQSTKEVRARLLWIETLLQAADWHTAHAALIELESLPLGPELLAQVASCHLRMRKTEDALRAYHRALAIFPDSAESHQGLSSCYCRLGDNQRTVDHALAAVSLVFHLPKAHLNLGVALARSEQYQRAVFALETALSINPSIRKAHRCLALIYANILQDPDKADHHRHQAATLATQQILLANQTESLVAVDDSERLPEIPPEAQRIRLLNEKRPRPISPAHRSGKTFVLVSGLPRSGTSLLMQMLEAGGLAPKTDGNRQPDQDNPRGYYEWEAVRGLATSPHLFDEHGLDDKAVKVVSALLPHLPYQHHYRVIFMDRAVHEVAASQARMIANLGTRRTQLSTQAIERQLVMHRERAVDWLSQHPRAEVLLVNYAELLEWPHEQIPRIVSFVGPERLPHADEMASVIEPQLYRNR